MQNCNSKLKIKTPLLFLLSTSYYLLVASSVFAQIPDAGTFNPPLGSAFGSENEPGGLVNLLNNFLRLFFLIAGIYVFIQFIYAGYEYINAGGDPKKLQSAWNRIWKSILGLIIMISSFIIAVIFGQVFFGDPGAILNLQIVGPGN